MSVRPETAGNGHGTGSFYARVFDVAWKHAEHMTLTKNAGSSHGDVHENDLKASGPERAAATSRKPLADSHPPNRIRP
jgi:hypothetical protein